MEKISYASVKLVFICSFIFLLQLYYPQITDEFSLSTSRPWTFITYMFLHGSFQHIFYNMFALLMFGLILESLIGTKKFLIVYFLSGIMSGIVSIFFYNSVIGASGAIFGIIGCLTAIKPNMTVLAFGVPMPIIIASAMWIFIDFIGVIYPDQIAHMGHIGGFIFGFLVGLALKRPSEEKREIYEISERDFDRWEDEWF